MTTVSTLREEIVDDYAEHIVSIDQNVADDFDQETSFHAVCHPEIDTEGTPKLPHEIQEYVEEHSERYRTVWCGLHVHVHIETPPANIEFDDVSQEASTTIQQ